MWSPATGAPTSASVPSSAHARTSGVNRLSSTGTAGPSHSYPVSDSSGKTTTRARAARTASACARAFCATSRGTHGGCATASRSGVRFSAPPPVGATRGTGRFASWSILRIGS